MRQEQIYEDDVDENGYRGPSKSQLKREQNALQDLGREMTKLGDEQLKRIGLPDEVLVEIVEFPRLRTLVRTARKEREAQKPPKSARELYRYLHDLLEEPISLFAEDDENEE